MEMDEDRPEGFADGPAGGSRKSRAKRVRFLVGFTIILCAIVVLIVRANRSGVVYYVTVSELMKQGTSVERRGLRVAGKVVPGSVNRSSLDLSFRMTDGQANLPVRYHGVVPDTFTDDGEVVVEGKVTPNGSFEASYLMAKCPSKYQGADPQTKHPADVPKTL